MKKSIKAISILAGTAIGAGMFAIPYVMSKVGFVAGIIYLVVLGIIVITTNLMYSEVILRTPGDHQMNGYVRIYLGKDKEFLNILSTISIFVSLYGALLAYLIKIGEFSCLVLGTGNPTLISALFFILACFAIYFGLRVISSFEAFFLFFVIGLIVVIAISSFGKMNIDNFSGFNPSYFFLPYGVILFALTGTSVIPEVEEILRKEPKKMRKSIVIGSIIPLIIYIIFAISVVGVCGLSTSEDAISGLVLALPDYVIKLGAFLGILAMISSFLSLSYVLKEVWFRDFKAPKHLSFILTCLPSFLLFLFGSRSFIKILDFSGAISGGLIGVLILAMFKKSKKFGRRKPAFDLKIPDALIFILYFIFLLGIISPFLWKP